MKRKTCTMIVLLLLMAAGCCLRLWNLTAGVDSQGIPLNGHSSVYALLGAAALAALVFGLLAVSSPGRSGERRVLTYSGPLAVLAYAGGAWVALSAALDFAAALVSGATAWSPILCLLGLLSGGCLLAVAYCRGNGKKVSPGAELIPDLYLVVKLIFYFKDWSIDPIILDYCVKFFALIFAVMAFYQSTGFLFESGKPRRTLFTALCACFFSAMAMVDGVMDGSAATVTDYLSLILWLIPVLLCLCNPAQPPEPAEEKPEDTEAPGAAEAAE